MANKVVQIKNPLPSRNALGRKYPRWHAKHPANGVVTTSNVARTIKN